MVQVKQVHRALFKACANSARPFAPIPLNFPIRNQHTLKQLLILGAGRSSSTLIQESLKRAEVLGWKVQVGDLDGKLAAAKVAGHPNGDAFALDPADAAERDRRIRESDLVISMVPAFLHAPIAQVAIAAGKPVITPSYIAPEMQALDGAARDAGVLVLNEIGLDPGIDHMSAMKILDEIREAGGAVRGFESYCGGLIAPDSDTNPWHYKFSWNPRNVVIAGQAGPATFLDGGRVRMVPPHRLFHQVRSVEVAGTSYEGYPNRDSLAYRERYGLKAAQTLVRGTLRGEGFCEAWQAFVALGCVRDDVQLSWPEGVNWPTWLRTFLPAELAGREIRDAVAVTTGASDAALDRWEWLGLFDAEKGPRTVTGSPADVLQDLLERAWRLEPQDRDMIVMWHRFEYELDGAVRERISALRLEGRDSTLTAMSDTVGLPMLMAAEVILEEGGFGRTGVEAPMDRAYYDRLLPRLEAWGIRFEETDRAL